MKLFTYKAWGVPGTGFDPSYTFVRSHFVPPIVLACIRALFCIYSFTTIVTCYTWLAHETATVHLKDVNLNSYTIHQGDAAIGQSFSFFTYLYVYTYRLYKGFLLTSHLLVHSGHSASTSWSLAFTPSCTPSNNAHGCTVGQSHSSSPTVSTTLHLLRFPSSSPSYSGEP